MGVGRVRHHGCDRYCICQFMCVYTLHKCNYTLHLEFMQALISNRALMEINGRVGDRVVNGVYQLTPADSVWFGTFILVPPSRLLLERLDRPYAPNSGATSALATARPPCCFLLFPALTPVCREGYCAKYYCKCDLPVSFNVRFAAAGRLPFQLCIP